MARKGKKTPQRKSYERNVEQPVAITPVEYGGVQEAFDHFNGELFGGELPDCFFVYQRRSHSGGHFAPNRFVGRGINFARHELSLNPDGFVGKTDEFICSILVHEMTHCWQEHFGAKKKREDYRYHDREWALKMKSMGLQPSNTGMVGGKETGVRMAHYIIPGGPFVQSYEKLAATGWKLNLQSAYRPSGTRAPNSKVKSTCLSCGGNAWSKPNYQLACVACGNVPMVADVVVVQSYDQAA
jgi:hypothetical protein